MVVTKIQAATDVKIITRLAAYIRVSSDSDDQLHSFSAQYRYYNQIAANSTDTILIDIYADEGITGTCTDKRDEFNRMMNDARKHKFDRVIVKSVTRFARNTKDCLEAVRELKQLGISVYFEENNIDTNKTDGEAMITLLGMVAQNESLSISKNMRWGIQKRMQNGTYINHSSAYGYRYEDRKHLIDEPAADTVRRIFSDYLNGLGVQTIAETLSEETGESWNYTKVRYILGNERYIGDSLFQKKYNTDTLPFKKKLNKGELPRYYVEGTQEPIIDRDTFNSVQELLKRRENNNPQGYQYIFTKKIVCSHCGHSFKRIVIKGIVYWVCNYHNKNSKNCPMKPIPETAIQDAYIRMFNKLKRFGQEIISPAIGQLEDLIMKKQCGNQQILASRTELMAAREKMNQITRLHSGGLFSDDIYNAQKKEIEAKIMRLKDLMTAACDTDGIVSTLDKLSDLMDILNEHEVMTEFDETVFGLMVEKITALSEKEIVFRLIGGVEFTETIERR
ncbi:MAG: recombinase family protein [Ruminiclostridium sp.]|nr:recombinase family protein [Ruminiclostridium sp.]